MEDHHYAHLALHLANITAIAQAGRVAKHHWEAMDICRGLDHIACCARAGCHNRDVALAQDVDQACCVEV